jgi:2-iminobutanoate/2-iminopropanoate deaminase
MGMAVHGRIVDFRTDSRRPFVRTAFNAPGAAAIAPYSHAVDADGLVFLSGQTPVDPKTGQLIAGSAGEQAAQCLRNLFQVLEAAKLTPDDVVNVQVYLVDMGDFAAMNEVYVKHFSKPYPARTTIGVASLPFGARVEIGMMARRPR